MDKKRLRKLAGLPLKEAVSKAEFVGAADGETFGGGAELELRSKSSLDRILGSISIDGSDPDGRDDSRELRLDALFFRYETPLKVRRSEKEDLKLANQKIKEMEKATKTYIATLEKILRK